jgi:hypothetical protein
MSEGETPFHFLIYRQRGNINRSKISPFSF